MTFTYPELKKCAEREVMMRERVYGKRVEAGTMNQEDADREIAMMKEIEDILEYLSQPRLKLEFDA